MEENSYLKIQSIIFKKIKYTNIIRKYNGKYHLKYFVAKILTALCIKEYTYILLFVLNPY